MTGNRKDNKNGIDEFSRFLIWGGVILCIICGLLKATFMLIPGIIVVGFGIYRILSLDSVTGAKQNREYLFRRNKVCDRISELFSDICASILNLMLKFKNRNSKECMSHKCFRVFKCPSCRQKLRVPCGKGRIQIHCSRCGSYFIKKT